MAVVLLSLTFIERELCAMLYARGVGAAKNVKLMQILDWAVDHKCLELDNKQKFDTLRQLRNAYAHVRPPLHEEGLIRRTVEVADSVNGIIEA
ncbi:MAG: hypothetical protein V6Z86_06875 [Hyphomicrobiales bacterium]